MDSLNATPKEKHAAIIFMTLTTKAREIFNMDIEAVTAKTGVKNLLEEIGKMYLKEKSSQV